MTDTREKLALQFGIFAQSQTAATAEGLADAILAAVREEHANVNGLSWYEELKLGLHIVERDLAALTQRVEAEWVDELKNETLRRDLDALAQRVAALEKVVCDIASVMLRHKVQDHGGTEAAEPDASVQAAIPPAGAASVRPAPAPAEWSDRCQYCGEVFDTEDILYHEQRCPKAPAPDDFELSVPFVPDGQTTGQFAKSTPTFPSERALHEAFTTNSSDFGDAIAAAYAVDRPAIEAEVLREFELYANRTMYGVDVGPLSKKAERFLRERNNE